MSVSLSSAAAVEEKRRRLARLLEERASLPQRFPLSFSQQRLWFLDQLDPGSPAYQLSTALHLRGLLRPAALEASLQEIVRRHKVLRTRFTIHEGEPVQIVDRHVELTLPVVDLSGLPDGPRQGELRRLVQGNIQTLFDLRHGHLFRNTLLRLGERQHAVLLATHHIVSDGWSMGVIVKELATLYPAFCAGRPSPLPRLPLQYAEYAVWQRRWLTGDVLDAQLGYWKERLNGAASLEFPTDHPRPTVQTFRGAAVPFSCPLALRDALAGLGRQQGATLFMTLLAVFQTLLGRFSGQEDVSIGSPIANRGRRELELLIGFFANTLVLRADLSGDPPFRELLARVRETTLGAFAHQDMPLEKLVQEVQPERNLARSPLFQVLFALQTAAELVLELPDLALEPIEAERDAAKLELSLELAESSWGIQGVLEYNTDLFERPTAARLLGCFEWLLEAVLAAPEQRLSGLPLLSPGERHHILAEWNDTAATYPGGLGLQELFEAQVRRSPEAVALVFEGEELRYGELNARANRLAHLLRRWGVGSGVRVGVCLERSPEMVVGLLAALKAGGAYVPLDPAYPRDRLAFLLTDARVPVLLTQERLLTTLATLQPQEPGAPTPRILCLDGRQGDLDGESAENPFPLGSADELAYVIYTSGSTGRPKGAMNSHRAICNRLLWLQAVDGLTAEDRVFQKTPFSFDISVWEFFWPLATGARLVLARPGGHQDPDYLVRLITQAGITTVHFVPSMLQVFLEARGVESCASLRRVICSGEALTAQLARRFFARFPAGAAPVLYNLYGPTEAAVEVTAWRCEPESQLAAVPIGRPIANTQALVLDAHLGAMPIGVPGELYLGGVQLARGYLDRPDLTAERFLPDPFAAAESAGARLYRTGDQVRRLPGGEIVYLGRLDHQVKVRGFRIEPGEIEAALLAHGVVRSAVVLPRQDGGSLVAYVETARDGVSAGELRELLRGRLPEHMVPAAYVLLESIPLTANGKLDRKALAALPLEPVERGNAAAPRTQAEELVAGIFADVLKLEQVGAAADFFELGGHSLLATQVVSRVQAVFGVDLGVREVFEAPTVVALAARIKQEGRGPQAPPIVPVPRAGRLPLSFAQQRLWFLDQLEPGSAVYNIPAAVELTGHLKVAVLAAALAEVMRRHEVLRTTFQAVAGEPVQVVAEGAEPGLPVIDLSSLPESERGKKASHLAAAEVRRLFDLGRGPLLRWMLLKLGVTQHVALVTMHHIVSDGWSIGVLVREVGELYAALLAGRPSPLPELAVQYADFAAWQRQRLSGELLESELAWWRGQLTGMPPALELPVDHPRPSIQGAQGAVQSFAIDGEGLAGLTALCRRHGATLFMTLLAGFAGLLQRTTGEDDLAVGMPIAGRTRVELEPLIGFFVNTLVLRLDLSGDPDLVELLGRARERTLSAYAHQEVPFERLVEELAVERDLSRPPLVQVLFVLQNAPADPLELPGLELKASAVSTGTAKFELTCAMVETERGLEGTIEYRRDLFEVATMERLSRHFTRLLAAAVAEPRRRLAELPLLSPGERHQMLGEWNDTATAYLDGVCLHELVAAQAARTPEVVAASFEGTALTYRELMSWARRLARHLRALGVEPDGRVGVLLERSLEMIVGLLGVMEAGAAYVPLDPSLPAERLDALAESAGLSVILTLERLSALVPARGERVVLLDRDWSEIAESSGAPLAVRVGEGNLAYVLYTSGSTGAPKGVMISHQGIVNRLLWMQEAFGLTSADRVLQKTPFGFDVSLWEFFWPLLTGARLVFARPGGHKDPQYLVDLIAREGITTLHFVPSMLEAFLEAPGVESLGSVRRVVASGEALPPPLVRRFFARLGHAELHNLYGPTEASVDVSVWSCRPESAGASLPIGRPIANHGLYVVDRSLGAQPVGVPGELLLGGPGLARGYLGRPDLTAAAFIPDPFGGAPGGRLYRTGDLTRHLPDGSVEFLGRIDHQVKVRGFRIELGEIEAALARQPGVREAVVLVREEEPGDKRLVAYVVWAGEPGASAAELREALRRSLPEYMVPADVVAVESLPLTANGKVDRRALSRIVPVAERAAVWTAPRGPVEEVLAAIWTEVLGAARVERVGAEEDFFALGGHSLLATQVISRVREAFGAEMPLRSLFEAPTVARFAARIGLVGRGPQAPPIVPVPREGSLPLSFAQQRLWFLDQLEPDSPVYNVPAAVELTGQLAVAVLAAALAEVVRRHEVLRTTFQAVAGEPVQVIAPGAEPDLPVIDLGSLPEEERGREAGRLTAAEAQRRFDLGGGPLLRTALLRLGAERHVALVTMHHIVSDGWSIGVLVREVGELYAAVLAGRPSPLPELAVQYADFAAWQRRRLSGELLESELAWWRGQLAGMPPALELPVDHPRPALEGMQGAVHNFAIDGEGLAELTALCRRQGVTLFMALLAGFAELLQRITGEDDLAVGTPIAGRTRVELEPLIGFFINTLVLRLDLAGDPELVKLLERVRDRTLGAYAHQEVPFERLVEELAVERDLSRPALVQVLFVVQNAPAGPLELPGLELKASAAPTGTAKLELTCVMVETEQGLEGTIEYRRDLFEATTIERLSGHFTRLLAAAVAEPRRRLSELALLSLAERHQMLGEWNDTATAYLGGVCLHELVAAQAARTPEAVAATFEGAALSYRELVSRARRLARHLRALGIEPDGRVGVLLERSLEMIVGLLGVMEAGAAYVPLEPGLPAERLGALAESAGLPVILTLERHSALVPARGQRIVLLDRDWSGIAELSGAPLAVRVGEANLAYVLYTSGSTGTPKGVMIPHRGIVNRLLWMQEAYGLTAEDRVLQKTPFGFDVSLWEFFWPLLTGARLVFAQPEGHKDPQYLVDLVAREGITTLHFVPSMLEAFLEAPGLESLACLRRVMASGEALPPQLVRRFFARLGHAELHNLYGPTEASVDVSAWSCEPEPPRASVPIGRPIANHRLHVVDRWLGAQPAGVPGELLLGGPGLARGYLGRPELTAAVFVPDLFGATPGGRLYRTGDLVRQLADGTVQFLGRIDHQVKVRGFRIELGEIEAALARQPGVREAVVLVREEEPGDKRLVAYVVSAGEPGASATGLRETLRRSLPEPMVPSAIVTLESLPLTANGKVDRRALARIAPVAVREATGYAAPQGPGEEMLAAIWAEVLGPERVERVGARDDFFTLGGHSLLATQVISRVREAFGVELPVRALFEAPTVAALAARIGQESRGPQAPPLVPVPRDGNLPLSFAQQRLWFLDQLAPGNSFYNMYGAVRLTGKLDVEAMRRAFREIVGRHEALRTAFPLTNGRPFQTIAPAPDLQIPRIDLEALSGAVPEQALRHELARLAGEESQRPFDLMRGPLLRVHLLRLGPREHTLLVNLHHIVSDGWSLGVLFSELAALYGAFSQGAPSPLPELPIQYADFAVWQRQWLQGERLEAELDFWRQQLAGIPETLELPVDHPRPAVESFRGGSQPFTLPAELVRELTALTRRHGATLSMTMLGGFQTLLGRCVGREDIATGMAIANRTRREIEGLIGFFVNTLVVRTALSGSPGFGRLLTRVRDTALAAYAHQDLPFERLVEELQPDRALNRNPLIQVMFAYQNFPRAAMDIRGLVLSPPDAGQVATGTAKFDLTLFLFEDGDGLLGSLEYNRELFEATTLQRLACHLESLLAAAAAAPETAVALLPFFSAGERHQLAREWNDTDAAYPSTASLQELFEEQVRRRTGEPALLFDGGKVSWGELNRRANRLAARLRALRVEPESRVGLCVVRSPELVVGMLGIVKAGAAYVPLDPDYPGERLALMVEDSGVRVLVTQEPAVTRLPASLLATVEVVSPEVGPAEPDENPPVTTSGESLAHVIYTSGSTGRPKGVCLPHRAVARLVLGVSYADLGPGQVFSQFAPVSFDPSTFEIWGALLNGSRLALAPPYALSLEELGHAIERFGMTTVWLTTVIFHQFVEHRLDLLRQVPQVLAGGDALSPSHVRRLLQELPDTRLVNGYGPTENACFTTCYTMQGPEPIGSTTPLGHPMANTQVHLLDPQGQPVPIGVAGELCTGGGGLSRGYLGRPDLTAERFVPNPFGGTGREAAGSRLYRTGDLARYFPDGRVEFLGRIDHQVKIRGFRIELGEIEARFGEHPAVLRSVVVAREDVPGDRRLVAYVVQNPAYEGGEQKEQVSQWSELFDDLYRKQAAGADPTFNIVGWNSAYTGLPLPAGEMEEWLEDTVQRIAALAPQRVLEIGCGTGMILFRVAPGCEQYTATDISGRALEYVDGQLDHVAGLDRSRVQLLQGGVERLDGLAAGCFDTAILNSVAQYFPSAEYLAVVVTRLVELVRPGGAIFLGDLRSLPLLEAFHTSLELFQAEEEMPLALLRQKVQARRGQESELVVDPAFFAALRKRLPDLGRVEIHPKRGRAHNELTGFRYQVVLRIGPQAGETAAISWVDWWETGLTLAALRWHLEESRPACLSLRNVPNARVDAAAEAVRLLREGGEGVATAGDLRRRAATAAAGAVEPQDLWDLARDLPYDVELGWASPGADGAFEAVLRRRDGAAPALAALLPAAEPIDGEPLSRYTNNPLQGQFARRIVPELRAFLEERLPEYMVPAAFVLLDALPLSPSGKLDRRRLPAPDAAARPETGSPLVAPRNPVEAKLVGIWRELLGVERIGVDDDFFALGGHSLLATQALSRVRAALGIELPLRTFFERPTVAALAAEVEALLRAGAESEAPPIMPVRRDGPLPLSFAQERLWFLHLLDRRVLAYNESSVFRLHGRLDEAAFQWSLDGVVRRHESLRTVFPEVEGWAAQLILPPAPLDLPTVDLRGLPASAQEEEAARLAREQARHPFDLARGPLVRGLLVRLNETEHAVLFFFHHIVFDGWSTSIFARELSTLYAARIAGEPSHLPPLPVQYGDFAVWQRQWLQGEALERRLGYWRERLAGVAVLDLPTDRPRRARPAAAGDWRPVAIAPGLTQGLRKISRRQGATLFMTVLAAFQALLHRLAGEDDIAVGTPIANRNRGELEDLIGFFVNMLVLRTDLSGSPAFAELVSRAREASLGAYAHQDLPFEKLVAELQPDRDLLHNPLFQVGFQLLNLPPAQLEMPGLSPSPFPFETRFAKFDLNMVLTEEEERISGLIDYDSELFDEPTVVRFLHHFEAVLAAVAADPAVVLSEIPLLSPWERHQLLAEWGGTEQEPSAGTLHGRFAEQARRRPEAPAVRCAGATLSYGELARRAAQLARRLRELGVGPESRVALCLERSPDLVVGILGILEAGGAYVPLDSGYPRERLAYMVEDSGARVAVASSQTVGALPDLPYAVLLDAHREELDALPAGGLEPLVDGAGLAYVIYTSGSTGNPKGALVTHGNALRLFDATSEWFGFGESDVWTLFHSYAFDFSVWEIWGALLYGGRLVVVPYEVSRSPEMFLDLLAGEGVTVLNQTPSAFAELAKVDEERGGAATDLRLVIFGGEALDLPGLAPWFERHGDERPQLVNMYGITETTVHVTYRPLRAADARGGRRSAIGVPIPDLSLHVLDPWLRPAPIGGPGELAVGGAGLARGYLSRPELTAERFVPDPFGGRPGARLYRSGDLARYLADGDLEYLGRIDHQVKIRGFRIELGEIQAALEEHPAVRQAVVLPKEEPGGERRLVAFLVARPGAEPSATELRAALARRLPDYMVPAGFVTVADLPLTRNGKVDRKALLSMAVLGRDEEVAYAPPRNPVEQALVEVWQGVLGLDRIGIDDRFFSLGGDSILSLRVCALARQRGLSVSLDQLFEHQTVRELSEALGGEDGSEDEPATEPFALLAEHDRLALPEGLEDAYPLAALQTGMLFHGGYTETSTLYQNVTSLRLEAPFDGDALREAIAELLARHPVLRTSFDASRFSEPLQLVHRRVEPPVEVEDLRSLRPRDRDRRVDGAIEEERHRKFDETAAPLLRFRVQLLEDGVFQFTWTEHHAILDGWSVAALSAELFRLYRELRLGRPSPPPLPSRMEFRDFVALERRSLSSEEDRRFWLRKLEGAPRMRLPRRPGRQEEREPRMRSLGVTLEPGLAGRLQRLAGSLGMPFKHVLLAAHYRVLAAATGQSDLVSGLVVNGRPEAEGGDRVLGLFLNTVPLRLRLSGGAWTDLVRQTLEAEQELNPFRRYPMADLQRRLGGGELFETAFNYVHFHVLQGLASDGELRVLATRVHAETNLPLNVSFNLDGSWLGCEVEYDETLFDAAQVAALAVRYPRALERMAEHPEERYDAHPLLSEPERHQHLHEWNDTRTRHPDRPVHEQFELRAAAAPEAVALIQGESSLTYGELRGQARRLADRLRSLGVGPEVRAGLLLDRSPGLIVGLLGILWAGGACLPLEPEHPETRLRHILEDSRAAVLVTRSDLARSLPSPGIPTVLLDGDGESGPGSAPRRGDLAYVIYTSGSTGAPKGVLVGHGPLANAIGFSVRRYGLKPGDRVLQFASIGFDASLEEIFSALASGATLVLRDDAMLESPRHLLAAAADLGITVLSLPTAYWHKVVAALAAGEARWPSSVRLVAIGGERAQGESLARWLALGLDGVELVNIYGPTEATIGCTHAALQDPAAAGAEEVPIGRPYANARVYLLGSDLQPVAPGAAGELHVGGDVLARGYLGLPALTAERFVPDPLGGVPGARMYRTGDLAAHRPDGNLEFRGRSDAQVKVRGFRIELGEIEAALGRHPGVREAVIVAREREGETMLAGYVVPGEPRPTAGELQRFLRGQVPAYMIPPALALLDRLPLTVHGKVDTAALPAPEPARMPERESLAPRDALELQLVRLWEDLLGVRPLGVRDDFFELGGHSLVAVQLVARLQRSLGVSLPLATLLRNPTIERLAAALRDGEPARGPLVELASGEGKPFFCVHAVGGEVFGYLHLARGLARPVYGLQAAEVWAPDTTLEEMAARHLVALREVQPAGPYSLGGWSMGGVLAFEMARQLERQGETVDLLVLLDSFAPDGGSSPQPATDSGMVALFAYDLARLLGIRLLDLPPGFGELAAGEALSWLAAEAERSGLLPPGLQGKQWERRFEIFQANFRAVERYAGGPCAAPALLFQATAHPQPDAGWGRLLTRPVEVRGVTGDHYTLLQRPGADEITALLRQRLARLS